MARPHPVFVAATLVLSSGLCLGCRPAGASEAPEGSEAAPKEYRLAQDQVVDADLDAHQNLSGGLVISGLPSSLVIDDGGNKALSIMTFAAAPGELRYTGPGGRVLTIEEVESIKFYEQVLVIRTPKQVVLVPVEAFIDARGPDNVPPEDAPPP